MGSFVKDTVTVAISKGARIAFGLANSVIIARVLGPSASGVVAAVMVIPSILATVGSLGVRQATGYFVGSKKHSLEEIKSAITQLWLISSTICFIGSFFIASLLASDDKDNYMLLFACAQIPFALFNSYNTGIFLGQNKIRRFARINWLPKAITLFTTIALVAIIGWGIHGAILSLTSGALFTSVVLLFQNRFLNSFTWKVNWKLIGGLVRLGIVYALAMLILRLNYKADIVILDQIAESYDVGIYAKGANIMEYLWQIPMLFSSVTFARSLTTEDNKQFSLKVSQLLRVCLVLVSIVALILGIFATPIIVALFGSAFQPSARVLQILLPGVVLLTILKVLNMDLAGRGKPWIAIVAMGPALIVNIVLNFILIPQYGANGAAFASTVSYGLGGILILFLYGKETEQSVWSMLRINHTDVALLRQRFSKLLAKK